MIRDEELKRLIKYAQGLNVQVKFKPFDPSYGAEAEWNIDGSEITIFKRKNSSKIALVLCLVHELGHHLEYIHNNNRMLDPKLEEALDESDRKNMRKRIYEWEVKGAEWWEIIRKETDLKISLPRLRKERDLDVWMYEVYYETGEFPNRIKQRIKRKEFRKKYGF